MNATRAAIYEQLLRSALAAAENSYSPYSRYAVGASVLTFDDRIYTGCNVENASFTLTIHAEQIALAKAIADGALNDALRQGVSQFQLVKAVACATVKTTGTWPCGVCRQFLCEFGTDMDVVVRSEAGSVIWQPLSSLVPHAFVPEAVLGANSML